MIQTGTIAAVAVAFARFTGVFVPALTPDVFLGFTAHLPSGDIQIGLSPQRLLAIVSVVVLTWINIRGVRTAAVIQTALTGIKLASLAALVVLGLSIGRNALRDHCQLWTWILGRNFIRAAAAQHRGRDDRRAVRHGCLEQRRLCGR